MINLWVELQCHSIFEKVFTDFFHKIILGHQPNCTRNLQFADLCDWVGDIFLFIIIKLIVRLNLIKLVRTCTVCHIQNVRAKD